jgi:polysaccharide pyruvyl transferase WcaK-like protein
LRDTESLSEIPEGEGLEARIRSGADCALSIDPAETGTVDRIIADEDLSPGGKPFLTWNVNSYIDVFVRDRGQRTGIEEFAAIMSQAVNQVLQRLDRNIVFVMTQPMDMKINQLVMDGIDQQDRIRFISNKKYSFAELAGVFSRAEIHVGMRTHSLILASSMCTPVVGIIATPKNRGYMKSIDQDDRMVEFDVLTPEHLSDKVIATWKDRAILRTEMAPVMDREKAKAAAAAGFLESYLDPQKELQSS